MKKMYKAAMLAALGLASVTAAQAVSYDGDLLVGLTTASGNDVVYDLGSFSSLTYGETWDLTSVLSGAGLSLSGTTKWGIVGDANTDARYSWLTTASGTANTVSAITAWNKINAAVGSIYSSLSGSGLMGDYGTPSSSVAYSWYSQTAKGGSAASSAFSAVSQNPNTTGLGTWVVLSQQVAGGGVGSVTPAGFFDLQIVGGNDILSYQTVPEPGSMAMMAVGGGFLMLVGRNKFGRKQQS